MIKSELRSFHAVAVHGGFTAASRQLNISQPTLSTQVKNLEGRYGIELFNRVGKKVHLTLAGKELFQITSRLSRAETDAENLLESFRGFHAGTLNIAAVGPFHATDMIVGYKARFPSIDIEVHFGNSQKCVDQLLAYESDIAIIAEVKSDPRMITRPYSSHNVVVFVNADHEFANRDSISIHELDGQPVVRREVGSTTRSAIEAELDKRDIEVDIVIELGSREAIWKAVEKGLGLGFVADFEFVPHENLRAIPINDAQVVTEYHIACLKERANSKLVKSFVELAVSIGENL